MTNPTDPRIEAAARVIQKAVGGENSAFFDFLAADALKAADEAAWLPIESAPKDGTEILAKVRDDLYPAVKPERPDLERWNGRWIVVYHPGILEDGFDLGWGVAAPVGHGGFPDAWFDGWTRLSKP